MRIAACIVLALVTGAAIWIILRSPLTYASQDREQVSAGASSVHWTGTDELGRDRSIRTAGAMLLGLAGAIAASTLASTFAVGVGVTAAFAPSWLSKALMYVCDLCLTLPWIFMLMLVRSALPLTMSATHSALITFFLLGALGAPVFVRVNYMRALVVRRAGWLLHGRASGMGIVRLTRSHVLPHLRPLFLTQFVTFIPICLVAEANLGALGLGISQPLPSWGSMLLELQNSALLASSGWMYLPMGLLILVLFVFEMVLVEVDA